jgi:hypothetical protein
MGLHKDQEREGYDPTKPVRILLKEIGDLYYEAIDCVERAETDQMHRKLRSAINRLRPLWKFLKLMEVNSDWLEDFIDKKPYSAYRNLQHPGDHPVLDVLSDTESCREHFKECKGDGRHNDARAIEFYLLEGCEPCGEKLVAAAEKWRENGKTV